MLVALICSVIFISFLVYEAIYACRVRNRIKLRIAVTGVRGKSSVTRLITLALKQSGMRVLGKVTGSRAFLIYPNGEEEIIKRKRKPSVTEQIRVLLRTAKNQGVDSFVSETMSVSPEILRCEIQNILKPHIVVITHLCVDHVQELGNTIDQVRKNIVSVCNFNSTVITLKGNLDSSSIEVLKKKKCKVIEVEVRNEVPKPVDYIEFDENLALAYAVSEFLGLKEKTKDSLRKASGDIGALRCWKLHNGVIFVNGFAANDPDSTIRVFNMAKEFLAHNGLSSSKFVGILNLRSDRVDRTLQWLKQMKTWFPFERLYVTGPDNVLFARRIKDSRCLPVKPETILDEIERLDPQTVVFGFGNIAGVGLKLIDQLQESERCLRLQP
ncbi:MAG: poly-gamma-glutamate synthase PgsB [Pseudothermotoga sp.]